MPIVCIAGGPSLTAADVDACRGRSKVLAIKEAIRLAPWADWLYACDHKWWSRYGDDLQFDGPKFSLESPARKWATVLRNTGDSGLELAPGALRTGKNSGYQALNLAVQFGLADPSWDRRIILLGYDMQPDPSGEHHWFGKHPWQRRDGPPYGLFLPYFATLVGPLEALGVTVINASRATALTTFPRQTIEEALG